MFATDDWSFILLKVLSQDETPFLYSIVFVEGVVNDATSIVLFNAIQSFDFNNIDGTVALNLLGTFLYLYFTSTALGIVVSHYHSVVLQLLKLHWNTDYKSNFNTCQLMNFVPNSVAASQVSYILPFVLLVW